MKRLHLATWAALLSLGLLSGCQSCWTWGNGCGFGNGGLFSRFCGPRCPSVCCEGVPVTSELPLSPVVPNCPCPYNGGPTLPPVDGFGNGHFPSGPMLEQPPGLFPGA